MSFNQGQTATFTTSWGEEVEAEIIAVLPEDAKYRYAVEYTDADDGERVADFADDADLTDKPIQLTLNQSQLQDLHSILRVASADHITKYPKRDCSCFERIDTFTKLVEKALGVA